MVEAMSDTLSLQGRGLLADLEHHTSLAAHHAKLAAEAQQRLSQYLTGKTTVTASTANRKIPNCVVEWTEWMATHGPSLRQDIESGTGTKFTDKGYHYTVEWEDRMASFADNHFPDDQIMRIRTVREGRGGAPVAFFLWAQRWGVHAKFGVGPTEPRSPSDFEVSPIQGVVQPPENLNLGQTPQSGHEEELNLGQDIESGREVDLSPAPEELNLGQSAQSGRENDPEPFGTMEEWHAEWDPFLAELAPHDAKLSDEEMNLLISTLPSDIMDDPKAVVAVAYNRARRNATPS